jgi:hypothetical protein
MVMSAYPDGAPGSAWEACRVGRQGLTRPPACLNAQMKPIGYGRLNHLWKVLKTGRLWFCRRWASLHSCRYGWSWSSSLAGREKPPTHREEIRQKHPSPTTSGIRALATPLVPRLRRPKNNGSRNGRSRSGSPRVGQAVAIASTGEQQSVKLQMSSSVVRKSAKRGAQANPLLKLAAVAAGKPCIVAAPTERIPV